MNDQSSREAIEIAFQPKTVAIAGVSPEPKRGWGGGHMFVNAIRGFDRVEQMYALNPKGGKMQDGTPIYKSLRDVPGEVDLLISAVPASAILELVDDAVAKGVKVMHSFTAGFGETGDGERAELEALMLAKLSEAGIRLIGPNCMGIHSTLGGISWMEDASRETGRVGALSQSGMHATEIVQTGGRRAVHFSHVVSFGNAADLIECDYLDYFAENDDTDVVLAYIEGVKDGPRFVRSAREVARRKPLIILKGGLTEAGSRAASSHTGSLAGSAQIWDAVSKQAGFINVKDVEEMLDMALTIQHLGDVRGPRAAVIGGGGGVSVLAADACDRAGIQVPWLTEETQRKMAEFTPVAGTSVRNPIDSNITWDTRHFGDAMEAIGSDPNIDFLMLHFSVDGGPVRNKPGRESFEDRLVRNLDSVRETMKKPIALIVRPARSMEGAEMGFRMTERFGQAGYAVFSDIEDCAVAVRRYLDWRESRAEA